MGDLEAIFDDTSAETTEAPEVEEAEVEEAPEAPEEVSIPEEAEGKDEDAPPASAVEDEASKGLMAALKDERRKRQDLERRVEAQERQVAEAKPVQPRPDIQTDPEGFARDIEHRVEQRLLQTRLNDSEALARAEHPDFEDMMSIFEDGVRENPALFNSMANNPKPGEYAYQWAKNRVLLQEVGDDPAAYRERLRQELIEEMSVQPEAKKPRSDLPASLAKARNTGARSGPKWSGPESDEEIFGM